MKIRDLKKIIDKLDDGIDVFAAQKCDNPEDDQYKVSGAFILNSFEEPDYNLKQNLVLKID